VREKAAISIITIFSFALLFSGRLPAGDGETFYFTVTSDPHGGYERFGHLCDAINKHLGGAGAFHVTTGDQVGSIAKNRAVIDKYFGKTALWYPIAGNHDIDKPTELEWLRNEFENGNSLRSPIRERIKNAGPAGSSRTTYSWDYGNAHFIVLNVYWNGEANEGTGRENGSDTAGKGDIVPALLKWLKEDLAANHKPFTFVFGHEPAFPSKRHEGNSLDAYGQNRDAFWSLLESAGVTAYVCGHTHYYSARKGDAGNAGNVWQIGAGSAGRNEDGQTFLQFIVGSREASLNVYRNSGSPSYVKAASFTFMPGNKIANDESGQRPCILQSVIRYSKDCFKSGPGRSRLGSVL